MFLLDQIFHVDVEVDRPAEINNIPDAAVEHGGLYVAARPIEQVETDAPDAAVVKAL
jgi:hypothetical protein